MTDLVQQIADLSATKRALLAARNPLSFGQERLWFLDHLEGGNSAYHLGTALRLEGDLDVAALRRSLTEIARRHEALRTSFTAPDGKAMQVVHPPAEVPLPVIDLRSLSVAQEEEARRELAAGARRPFDLQRGRLLRCRLARLDGDAWIFLLTVHHIVFDGWSSDLLVQEMVTLYEAFQAGRTSPLPDLPIQYLDYARWQRQELQGERLVALLDYWKAHLQGAPRILELPLDRPRPKIRSGRGGLLSRKFSPLAAESLRRLAWVADVTPFSAALALFLAFLGRISAQEDVVVGFPVAGRTRPELEPLIGFFVNTLVVRADLSAGGSVVEHLTQVHQALADAQAHQEIPFERLVKELKLERDLSHSPVFQVLFTVPPPTRQQRTVRGLVIAPVELAAASAPFDLTLALGEGERGLRAQLAFARDVFDAVTAERLLDQFERFATAADEAGRRLEDLPLLGEAERHQLLAEWNDAAAAVPDVCLHHLVEAQARKTPDAVAVSAEGMDLTYRQLVRRSGRLAGRLLALGVVAEEKVGVCMQRSVDLIAALLGVLKVGGAYVPLDPAFPRERLALMLADSGTRVVLADRLSRGALGDEAAAVVLVDSTAEEGEGGAADSGPEVLADNLAYVIFTSGSTGRPKGVQVSHRALVNFLGAMAAKPGLAAGETLLAVTTLSFDIAALELFLPLTVGGRVALVSREVAADGTRLGAELERSGAVAMQATPATWRLLLDSGWQGVPWLRSLCGGEALPADLAQRLCARAAGVWNLYGPTETTVWSAVHAVEEGRGPTSIGRPIANTEIHLVDWQGAPAPVGVCGELRIGGCGVARGYLAQPDLTAQRFVPDPFSGRPGARLYCTGDLARRRADGAVEFMGRADQQVKVRGFRIELEEIETVLRSHATVRQAVVAVRGGAENRRLVAYVMAEGTAADPAELRSFLARRLPDYMVPWLFVSLDELPQTPNGKVDRRALPEPGEVGRVQRPDYVQPATYVEQKLAEVWREVLRQERIGVQDHFFELGGDSILSMRVVIKARQAGIGITPRQVFQYPVLGRLAASAASGSASAEPAPELANAALSEAELDAVLAQVDLAR
jgi:amino acid adenylation domain-containing protein